MRKGLWLLPISLAIWAGYQAFHATAPIYRAFKATGALATGYALNVWVELPTDRAGHPLGYAKTLAQGLHMPGMVKRQAGPGWIKDSVADTVGSVTTQVVAERLATGATYIVVDRSVRGGLQALQENVAVLHRSLTPYGRPHASVTLIGSVPGQLTTRRVRQLMAQALRAVNAVQIDAVKTREMVSVTAFSPLISETLMMQNRRIDLELAETFNPQSDQTEILVGSPVITVTY